MQELYLDANAHVPLSPKTLKAYSDILHSKAGHGHPSSLASPGREAHKVLEDSRNRIAELLGAKNSSQIIFTNSCTQACEWGLRIIKNIEVKNADKIDILVSPLEHPAIRNLCNDLPIMVMSKNEGVVDFELSQAEKIICIYMQNEIGTIQPLNNLSANYICSDLSQSIGKIPINLSELKVDIGMLGAHKWGGPSGVGILYLKEPEIWQEFNQQSHYYFDIPGTPNVCGIYASMIALEETVLTLPERTENMNNFQLTLESGAEQLGLEVIAKNSKRSPNTSYLGGFKKALDNLLTLSDVGIHVGLGSACSSYATNVSPLLQILGKNYTMNEVMRISQWGNYGKNEAIHLLNEMEKIL